MRHCTISCESAMACGPSMIPIIRVAGVGNEIQGLVLFDLPNLGGRLTGDEPWAFQLDDLFDNEDGFFCSARNRRNPCQTCEQCCQSNLDSGRQLKQVFAKTVIETVPPPRTPLYGWP